MNGLQIRAHTPLRIHKDFSRGYPSTGSCKGINFHINFQGSAFLKLTGSKKPLCPKSCLCTLQKKGTMQTLLCCIARGGKLRLQAKPNGTLFNNYSKHHEPIKAACLAHVSDTGEAGSQKLNMVARRIGKFLPNNFASSFS